MTILHICNDFSWTRVHKNLYTSLDNLGLKQKVFHPLRDSSLIGSNCFDFKTTGSEIIYSEHMSLSDRFLFRKKINFLSADLTKKVDLKSVDMVHATTLFSDGAIALRIYKKYKIPYVLAVRGTDINLFLKYGFHLHGLAREILLNASRIIFISTALRENLINHPAIARIKTDILAKSELVHNGINQFWLSQTSERIRKSSPVRFLYVGNYSRNKNVLSLVKAFLEVRKKHPEIRLNLVGAHGKSEARVQELSKTYHGIINYLGPVFDKELLKKIYTENDVFAMVSKSETFGLVYIEALSQGLPVVYTKGQGIDGSFGTLKVGEAVNPNSISDISRGLEEIILKYTSYDSIQPVMKDFNWDAIGKRYANIYSEIIKNHQ